MTELPLQRLLLRVIQILERLKLNYMIMGGFAVRSWGVPRPTYDVDIAAAIPDEQRELLFLECESDGFTVPPEFRTGFLDRVGGLDKAKITWFEDGSVWDIDLFFVTGPLLRSALNRKCWRTIDGKRVAVMAPEDIILLKLIAFRRKDQLDIEEILQITSQVDRDYLRSWAKRLQVAERLETFLSEIS